MPRKWTKAEEKIERRELEKFYVRENKTIAEVAEILGIKESTVFDRMLRLGVESRRELKPGFNNKRRGILLPDFSDKLAEFTGTMLGDGHIAKRQ